MVDRHYAAGRWYDDQASGYGFTFNSSLAAAVDNRALFGSANYRWQAVFSVNGTIQTSDRRDNAER